MTDSPPLLDMRSLSVARSDRVVLQEVNLQIGLGEHVAILGPNGCGKSTLIKTITRECYPLVRPHSTCTLLGQEHWNVFELRSLLGIVTNDLMMNCTRELTGREVVISGYFSSIGIWPHHQITPIMIENADKVLHRLQALHLADRFITELSSGEARRILIGRALVHDPKALIFDEPSNSLDVFAQHELREIMRTLAQSGIGIILVTHHLADIIPEIERVVLIRCGRIVADGPKHDVLAEDRLTNLFGLPINLAQRDGYYHLW